MKQTYRVLAGLIALGVLVQAAAIAFGWFSALSDIDSGAVIDGDYEGNAGHAIHGMNGMMVIPLLALVFLVVSFFAKIPGGVTWAALVFLAVVVQVALGLFAHALVGLGILHGANALVLFGLAVMAGKRVDTAVRTVTSPEAATV